MERLVDYRYSELISASFDILPPGIASRLRYTHFFTGTDPIYAGLIHPNDEGMRKSGYSFEDVAAVYRSGGSVSYAHNQTVYDKRTTIVLPRILPIDYPIHELGHVLDEILGWCHIAKPVTKYAEVNRMEAFAEAFTLWIIPEYKEYYDPLREVDEETLSLFRGLEKLWNYGGSHVRAQDIQV